MIQWDFEPGGIIPIWALRDMIRGYQANHPNSQLCVWLLSLDDAAFSAKLGRILAASNEKRSEL